MFLIGLGLVVLPADQSPEMAAAMKILFNILVWEGLTFRKTGLISRQSKSAMLIDFLPTRFQQNNVLLCALERRKSDWGQQLGSIIIEESVALHGEREDRFTARNGSSFSLQCSVDGAVQASPSAVVGRNLAGDRA